jgi:2-polyprenyl-6-methoxyphenol hydroxylase-like FAD-dependent oxidoreductase
VHVRIIDRLDEPTDASRAIAVHARSLDMFDRMGIADELIATGIKATAMQMYAGHKRLFRVPFDSVDSAFPFTLTTAQTETERVLGAHLQSLGVAVERGVELVALSQDGAAVHLSLRHPGGSMEQVTASWVIGADGARSTVRSLVGTKLAGSFGRWRILLGDVDADHDLALDSMHTFLSADGPVVVLPMRNGRMRFLAEVRDAPGTVVAQPAQPAPAQPAPPVQRVATVTNDVDVYNIAHDENPDANGVQGTKIGRLRAGEQVGLAGPCQPNDWCHIRASELPSGNGFVLGNLQF